MGHGEVRVKAEIFFNEKGEPTGYRIHAGSEREQEIVRDGVLKLLSPQEDESDGR